MTQTTDRPLLTPALQHPPYPASERQAEFIALADDLAQIAAAQAVAHDRDNTFAYDTFDELRRAGYLALTVPEEFGGRGASPIEMMLAQEHLARGSGAVGLGATMHHVIVGGLANSRSWPADRLGSFFLDVVANGSLINSAASEPDLGSPSRGGLYETTARRHGDGWIINGRKTWTTMSPGLTYAQVLLTIDDGDEPARGTFLVRMDTPGVRIEESWDNMSMRASGSNDVVFDDVMVSDEARLPQPKTLPGMQGSSWNLLGSAVYLGIAQAARDFAVDFARHRVPSGLGKPIAELQTVQHRVARMELLLLQARTVLYATAENWQRLPDQRSSLAPNLAAAKLLATNHAIEVTDLALRVVGSAGLQRAHPLERYFRDVRAGLGNPPMDDVALTTIGKAALAG